MGSDNHWNDYGKLSIIVPLLVKPRLMGNRGVAAGLLCGDVRIELGGQQMLRSVIDSPLGSRELD